MGERCADQRGYHPNVNNDGCSDSNAMMWKAPYDPF